MHSAAERISSFIIDRPGFGLEMLCVRHADCVQNKMVSFFPDCADLGSSDFPHSGITICFKWQGHFVVACGHREKWVLSNENSAKIDLGCFGPEWTGCSAVFKRG
jgi:hypothetical protein